MSKTAIQAAFDEAQARLEPKESLTPYAGQWVVLREGRVVASDPDPMRLRRRNDLKDSDVLMPVARIEGDCLVA